MNQKIINDIETQMQKVLDNSQLEKLHEVLNYYLQGCEVTFNETEEDEQDFNLLSLS